ncbi:MAG: hypothetical protein AVO35_04660 [Candidatus Aegiribacteria sp. MLS_C]|nr:MAG: hypothetical protein AVO35_04660 [Candidatus Aegiribacteria sp. MLS_C]
MEDDFDLLLKDEVSSHALASDIAGGHCFGHAGKRIPKGSNILYGLGSGSILKVFRREERDFRDNEALCLERLSGRLRVDVPELQATGEHDGYPYLIMRRMLGIPLDTVYDSMGIAERTLVAEAAGGLLKEMHSLPVSTLEGCVPEWSTFIGSQKDDLADNHAGYGLEHSRIAEVLEFVDDMEPVEEYQELVVCHTEIMPDHMFISSDKGSPRLTGLIDFEPSMLAVPQYELCAVGLFLSGGDPDLYGSLIDSLEPNYDHSPSTVMRMLLLHRYSNMNRFIGMLPEKLRDADLMTMAYFWFGIR